MSDQKHEIFLRNPAELFQFVHKEVEIRTFDGVSHKGWVYTVDPVSHSFVLIRYTDTDSIDQLETIMGHAVENVMITDENIEAHKGHMETLFKVQTDYPFSQKELSHRREKVKSWLTLNRIPVELSPDKPVTTSVNEVVLIRPPYTAGCCQSINQIVLSRIQELVQNMPAD